MENPQYFVFNVNPALLDQPRTIICTGMGRSGTSAVMSLLDFLGVWIGDSKSVRTRENKVLKKALHDDFESAATLIAKYDERFPVWGFKAPSLRSGLSETLRMFRNPMLIVPHRDIVGIVGRNSLGEENSVSIANLYRALIFQRRMLEELKTIDCPQLHIAFPLLSDSQKDALQTISEFVGVPMPDGDVRAYMARFRRKYLGPTPTLSQPIEKPSAPQVS